MGNNCAGIKNKKESLTNLVTTLNLGILFLQETKLYTKGQIKLKSFIIFETNRALNSGGGLMTAVHEKFVPSLVQTEQDNPDVLIVNCKLGANDVSLINGYGPQEHLGTPAVYSRLRKVTVDQLWLAGCTTLFHLQITSQRVLVV